MKTSSTLIGAVSLFVGVLAPFVARGEWTTLISTNSNPPFSVITLGSNDVAQVVDCFIPYPNYAAVCDLAIAANGTSLNRSGTGDPKKLIGMTVAGPATLTFNAASSCYVTLNITRQAVNTTPVPLATVVVPDDGGGPVTIVLEQSTDLVNWTAATPGTYGTTTQKRFFRLRAQR